MKVCLGYTLFNLPESSGPRNPKELYDPDGVPSRDDDPIGIIAKVLHDIRGDKLMGHISDEFNKGGSKAFRVQITEAPTGLQGITPTVINSSGEPTVDCLWSRDFSMYEVLSCGKRGYWHEYFLKEIRNARADKEALIKAETRKFDALSSIEL